MARKDYIVGSGNVFADLGHPRPAEALAKAELARKIAEVIAKRRLTQAAAAELKKRRGSIVNIVDIHAELPLKDYVIYTIAKGGLAALTRSLARELAPAVRVNGVSPGPILWPDADIWKSAKTRKHIVERTLLKRVGEPDDIARAVEFLIGSAPYVTGQIIAVDGGRSIAS